MRFPLLLSLIVPTFLVGCAGTQPPELLPGTITSARGVEMKVEGDGKAQKEEKKKTEPELIAQTTLAAFRGAGVAFTSTTTAQAACS